MKTSFIRIALFGLFFLASSFEIVQFSDQTLRSTKYYNRNIQEHFCLKPMEKHYKSVYMKLVCMNIPFPELFVKVSIYEAGWNYESYAAKHCHNIFGFSYYNKKEKMMWPISFKSLKHCVKYLQKWIVFNPPYADEDGISYLKRRGYNTENPNYYSYLQSIKPGLK